MVNTAETSWVACCLSPGCPAAAHSPTARMFSRTPLNAPLRSRLRSSAGVPSARTPLLVMADLGRCCVEVLMHVCKISGHAEGQMHAPHREKWLASQLAGIEATMVFWLHHSHLSSTHTCGNRKAAHCLTASLQAAPAPS